MPDFTICVNWVLLKRSVRQIMSKMYHREAKLTTKIGMNPRKSDAVKHLNETKQQQVAKM